MLDTLHSFQSRYVEMIGTRHETVTMFFWEIHFQTQIRRAGLRFVAHGGTCISDIVPKRIWKFDTGDVGGSKQLASWTLVHAITDALVPVAMLRTTNGRRMNNVGSTSPLMDRMRGDMCSKLPLVWLVVTSVAKKEAMIPLLVVRVVKTVKTKR